MTHSGGDGPYFIYGERETAYLKSKDKKLGEAIEQIGVIRRPVIPDLFQALVHSIIGQQISTKAQITVWQRFADRFHPVTPQHIAACPVEALQSCGISMRKARYIKNAAEKIVCGQLDLAALAREDDDTVCAKLSALDGIGVWTAQMLMIFSMQRPDIMSYGDLAIHRGLRMLYHHRTIDRDRFERYRRRYSPYATVASLYLWAIAGGAIGDMRDRAVKPAGRL